MVTGVAPIFHDIRADYNQGTIQTHARNSCFNSHCLHRIRRLKEDFHLCQSKKMSFSECNVKTSNFKRPSTLEMESDLTDTSFLVSQLVAHISSASRANMMQAIDVFRKHNSTFQSFDPAVFRFRWCNALQARGKMDETKTIQRNMSELMAKLKAPAAIFRLLDELRSTKSLPMSRTPPDLLPRQSCELPRDFLFVMQGMNGDTFRFSSAQKRFIFRGSLSPELLEPIKSVNCVGCIVRILNYFVESKDGIAHQHVADYVQSVLKSHFEFVASIGQSLSRISVVQFMSLMMSDRISDLKATGIVCQTVGGAKGGVLLNMLEELEMHGDVFVSAAAAKMKRACFRYVEEAIKDWVAKGEVDDPFGEFFVRRKASVIPCSKWWKEMYSLVKEEIPVDMSEEQAVLIFSTGKALNFLRQWDTPVILDIQEPDLMTFVKVAATEAQKRLLAFVNKDDELLKTLKYVHDYVLLQRGDFASLFCELDQDSLPRKIERIIHRISGQTVKEIDVEISDRRCQFVYNALPPVSAVFGQSEMIVYKLVSHLLLHLKKVEVTLVRLTLKRTNRPFSILVFEMLTFVRCVQDFVNAHVLKKSYEKLRNVFATATEFDEILKAHSTHINNIARGCFQTESGRQCRLELVRILDNIEDSIRSDQDVAQKRASLHEGILRFHKELVDHKAAGHELARLLLRMFKPVL